MKLFKERKKRKEFYKNLDIAHEQLQKLMKGEIQLTKEEQIEYLKKPLFSKEYFESLNRILKEK